MPWLAGEASERGISHIKSGAPCQDASCVWLSDDGRYLVGAVADGGGSLERSDLGSHIAVSHCVSASAARFSTADFDQASDQELEEHWRSIVRDIRAMIALEAELMVGASRDYGATLIGFAVFGDRFSAFQIGDGFLVLGEQVAGASQTYNLVFKARPVEHVGEVVWLTSSAWEEDFRCVTSEATFAFIAASTDGLEGVAISKREQQAFAGFFTPLAQRAGRATSSADLRELARSVITMKQLDAKTDDDKTLLIARRTS